MLGLKLAQRESGAYFSAADGHAVLRETYRITVGDIDAAMARQGIREITPGDVVLFRTGWNHLVRSEPKLVRHGIRIGEGSSC